MNLTGCLANGSTEMMQTGENLEENEANPYTTTWPNLGTNVHNGGGILEPSLSASTAFP
jgi:hypothetical protein